MRTTCNPVPEVIVKRATVGPQLVPESWQIVTTGDSWASNVPENEGRGTIGGMK